MSDDRQVARRPPAVVVAATLVFGLLGALWSVVVPLGEAPDEPAHLGLVLHLAAGHPYPRHDALLTSVAADRLCREYATSVRACPDEGEDKDVTPYRLHPTGEAPSRANRPPWDFDGSDVWMGPINQMPQHPPLYYQAMATALRIERWVAGGPPSVDRELALLRLLNVLLIAPLPLLAWATSRWAGWSDHVATLAALALAAVPQLSHIGSTLNNDNLLTLLGAILALLLAGVAQGDRRTRTALGVGVVTGLALLTKAFAIVFPPVVVVAYLVGRRRGYELEGGGAVRGPRRLARLRTWWAGPVVAGGVALLASGWWYLGVRSRTGSFVASIEDEDHVIPPLGFVPDLGSFIRRFEALVTERFWGSFGWYSATVPGWFTLAASLLFVAVVVLGFHRAWIVGRRRFSVLAVLALPTLLLAIFVFTRAWGLYRVSGHHPFIQGRYFFAGLTGLMVVAGVGIAKAGRWALPGVLAVVLFAQAEGLRIVLSTYWGGPGVGPRGQSRAVLAWGSWPTGTVVAAVVATTVAIAWLIWCVWREFGGPRPGADTGVPLESALR